MGRFTRRDVLRTGAIASLAAACSRDEPTPQAAPPSAEPARPPIDASVIRVASVKTAVEGGLLPVLIQRFEQASSLRVRLTTGSHVYHLAREGQVDLVISHFGHKDAESFVVDGLGEWPRMIFSNQMALFGPADDPAQVRGLDDLGEAFRRIAATRSKFLLNDQDGVRYLTEIIWNASGRPDRTGWFLDPKLSKDDAILEAARQRAYVLWGLTPFLRRTGAGPLALEPLVIDDPLLQRMMCSIIVKAGGVRRTNTDGAFAFQAHLLDPKTQAEIRTVHYSGEDQVNWAPAGRHNRTAFLPKG